VISGGRMDFSSRISYIGPVFTFTSEERRIIIFVLSAFVLGASVKACRETRRNRPPLLDSLPKPALFDPSPPPPEEAVPNPD
jgi:hypothetical protein